MRVTEMRPFCTHKHLISLAQKHRPFVPFRSLRTPLFLRSFADAWPPQAEKTPSSGNGSSWSKDRRVWTEFDPITNRAIQRRGPIKMEESGSGSVNDGQRTYLDEGERLYRNVKKVQPEGGSEASRSIDRRVEGFWVCSHCDHREEQRWESCKVCLCTGTMKRVTESSNQSGGVRAAGIRNIGYGSAEKASGGNDLNIGVSRESVRTSEDIVGNRLSEVEVSEKGVNRVGGGGVHPLPLTMKPEVESVSDGVTHASWSSSGSRINDLDGSVKNANFVAVNREKGVEYFSSESARTSEGIVGNRLSDLEVSKKGLNPVGGGVHPLPSEYASEDASLSSLDGSVKNANFVGANREKGVEYFSSESVRTSEAIVGNRLSELEVSKKGLNQVGGGVHTLPLKYASEDASLLSFGSRINDLDGSVKNANFEGESREKGVEYFSSERLTHGSVQGLGSREQMGEVPPMPQTMKQESGSTSQNEIQMGLSSSGSRTDDLDRDRTEGSSKRAKHVSKSESRSNFDEGEDVKKISREKSYRVVEQEFSIGDVVTSTKKNKKSKMMWVCKKCGHTEVQWWGLCKSCGRNGSMVQIYDGDSGGSGDEGGTCRVSENAVRSLYPKRDQVFPMRLIDVNRGINKQEWRIPLSGSFGSEVAGVLGGGIVPGSLVLVGGDPGVGKSTLLLQVASLVAQEQDIEEPHPVVYVSGEESVEQIGNRADRMGIGTNELFLYSGTDIEDILEKTHLLSPRLVIVDSIQTVYLKDASGSAGGVTQVKECTSSLLRYAKKTNVPVLLIGHVTKTGDIAGPRVLEHIVDVVLYLEGEKYTSHRLLRSIKNRFGSTDELGVFEMSQSGLKAVLNPSEMYLTEQYTDSDVLAGLAVAVVVDGTRTFLIEVQALCAACSKGSRHFNGVQDSRADMIISVLGKQAGLKLQENTIFLNVVSGVTIRETAGDLAIAAAICSSFLEFPIPTGFAFIGEIGLSGELRPVPRMDLRINTVAQLGYKKCIVPISVLKTLKGIDHKEMQIIGCSNLKNVINTVFRTPIEES